MLSCKPLVYVKSYDQPGLFFLAVYVWLSSSFSRRESTDVEDLFIAHISGMDTMARGLRNAAKLIEVMPCSIFLVSSFMCPRSPFSFA